jgi:uncharacterized protein with GYD domain
MPKFMFQAHYTVEGARAMAKEGGSSRRAAITKAAESAGGKLEGFYYSEVWTCSRSPICRTT